MATCSVGISFGSEFCVVAVTNTTGSSQVYANADGDRVTPCYSAFIDGEILHGNAAQQAYVRQPVQTIPYLLPLLSTQIVNEGHFQPKCEVEVVADASGEERVVLPTVDCDGVLPAVLPRKPEDAEDKTNPHTTTEIMHSFLADLKKKTIDGPCSGRPVGCLCVSVPRYMDMALVRSAIEGANLAKDVRVIYDDVATVIAHSIGSVGAAPGTAVILRGITDILVVDWGANVLSASILRLEGGVFRLLSHSHRFNAGGVFLDKFLAKKFAEDFQRRTRINATENARSMRKLVHALDGVRKTLTMSTTCPIEVEAFCDGMDYKDNLSRIKLDMSIRESGIVEKLQAVLKETVENADPSEEVYVEHVILAGGLCRTPFIQNCVKSCTASIVPGADEAAIHDAIPADEAAALGACTEALFSTSSADALTKPFADVHVSDKYRALNAAIKDVDYIDADLLEATVALYIGKDAFSKAPVVDAVKAGATTDFSKTAAEKGLYEIPTDQLFIVAPRGAPMPVSSPSITAAAGAAVVPVAIVASNDTHSFVVPLLKKAHKLESASFKVLMASENNGSVTAVTVAEIADNGDVKVGVRAEL